MEELIASLKDKAELRGISDDFVQKRIDEFFKSYPSFKRKYEENPEKFLKSKDYKLMQKEVRAVLREVYGAFILKKYSKMWKSLDKPIEILKMHRSSKERLDHYEEIYKHIFEITGKPKKILDLACGLNPLSYSFLGCTPEYYASDISPELCDLIQEFFDKNNIKGTAFVFDLLDFEPNKFTRHAKADVCFLFKALDSLETIERYFSEKLLQGIPASYIVVSFATQTLGGKKEIKERGWFEKLLRKLDLDHENFKVENETFYVLKN